jgi:hypothetical protein
MQAIIIAGSLPDGLQHGNDVNLDRTTLDRLTDGVLDAVAREDVVPSEALLFLLRRYSSGERPEVADTLGIAFARELDRQARRVSEDDPEGWLTLFSEGAARSDDSRLARAAATLVPLVRRRWSGPEVDVLMRSVEACLMAGNVPEATELTAEAIDAIEQAVARAYRPGAGVSHHATGTPFVRGGLRDQVSSASALLAAYAISRRLPYAMLADELMQFTLRTSMHEVEQGAAFAARCQAAQVCCRLAALHRDDEYRRVAVLAAGADYGREAARILSRLAQSMPEPGAAAAPFGLALAEWLDLQ